MEAHAKAVHTFIRRLPLIPSPRKESQVKKKKKERKLYTVYFSAVVGIIRAQYGTINTFVNSVPKNTAIIMGRMKDEEGKR